MIEVTFISHLSPAEVVGTDCSLEDFLKSGKAFKVRWKYKTLSSLLGRLISLAKQV